MCFHLPWDHSLMEDKNCILKLATMYEGIFFSLTVTPLGEANNCSIISLGLMVPHSYAFTYSNCAFLEYVL